jgi:hypothetical protein
MCYSLGIKVFYLFTIMFRSNHLGTDSIISFLKIDIITNDMQETIILGKLLPSHPDTLPILEEIRKKYKLPKKQVGEELNPPRRIAIESADDS